MTSPNTVGIALVTGAGSGFGRETAYTFAERGALAVIFADLNTAAAEEAAAHSRTFALHASYRAAALPVDITDKTSVQKLVDDVVAQFGRIDYFVNSAGTVSTNGVPITDPDYDDLKRVYEVNTLGTLISNGAVATAMLKQDERFVDGRSGHRSIGRGAIVNLASITGKLGFPFQIPYTISKFGTIAVSKTAAKELAAQGVRVNSLCPSWADTPMMVKVNARSPEMQEMVKKNVPLGRMAKVEEVAGYAHFLCSPDASYVIGQDVVIDAGFSLMSLT